MKTGPATSGLGSGIALVLLASCSFAGSDATIKYLGGFVPVLVLLWARYMFQSGVMATWHFARSRSFKFKSRAPMLQLVRGLLLLCNSTSAFYGVQFVPLAEFTALMMLAPVATTALAAVILKEPMSPARWALVACGVVGMLAVVRPTGEGSIGTSALLPIFGALCYAVFQLVTRRLATIDDLIVTNFLSALFITCAIGLVLWFLPLDIMPSLRSMGTAHWALLVLIGSLATLGQVSTAAAVRAAPLSLLMPFAYAQIAFAAAISAVLFHHAPDRWTVGGIGLIVFGGVGTVWLSGRSSLARLSRRKAQ
jgi:drug/metabolite transporter (DMT)-like permease